MKTAEMTGSDLNYWVGRALGLTSNTREGIKGVFIAVFLAGETGLDIQTEEDETFEPSTNWAHGGPIIEREKIRLTPEENGWGAWSGRASWFGPTPLMAAMRAFVGRKFGPEVPEA